MMSLKRHTRVLCIFPNRAALLRLPTALVMAQSGEWGSGRRCLNREPLEEGATAATPVT
jgi:hypothetical protein